MTKPFTNFAVTMLFRRSCHHLYAVLVTLSICREPNVNGAPVIAGSDDISAVVSAAADTTIRDEDVRIFVYDQFIKLPDGSGFEAIDEYFSRNKLHHKDANIAFLHHVRRSPFYTRNAAEATHFYVPNMVDLWYGHENVWGPRWKQYVDDVLAELQRDPAYRERLIQHPRRHIMMYADDFEMICDDRVNAESTEHLKQHYIILQFGGWQHNSPPWSRWYKESGHSGSFDCFWQTPHIVIPPVVHPDNHRQYNCYHDRASDRLFYRGDMGENADKLARRKVFTEHPNIYTKSTAVFALQAPGLGIWTARYIQYLRQCMIPVFTVPTVVLPFENVTLEYSKFAVRGIDEFLTNNASGVYNMNQIR